MGIGKYLYHRVTRNDLHTKSNRSILLDTFATKWQWLRRSFSSISPREVRKTLRQNSAMDRRLSLLCKRQATTNRYNRSLFSFCSAIGLKVRCLLGKLNFAAVLSLPKLYGTIVPYLWHFEAMLSMKKPTVIHARRLRAFVERKYVTVCIDNECPQRN